MEHEMMLTRTIPEVKSKIRFRPQIGTLAYSDDANQCARGEISQGLIVKLGEGGQRLQPVRGGNPGGVAFHEERGSAKADSSDSRGALYRLKSMTTLPLA